MGFCDICGRQAVTVEYAVVGGKEVAIYLCDRCLSTAEKNRLSTVDLVSLIKLGDLCRSYEIISVKL